MLTVKGVSVDFGGLKALDRVSFELGPDESLGILGANGSGKSTLVNVLSGLQRFRGELRLGGQRIDRLAAHRRRDLGMSRTFQNLQLSPNLTAHETLRVGTRRAPAAAQIDRALETFGLQSMRDLKVERMPYGTRKRLELARAFLGEPDLVVLDEPLAGLNGVEKEELIGAIGEVRRTRRMGMIIIEHDMAVIKALVDRVLVLNGGRVIAEGDFDTVSADPLVIEAYLGVSTGDPTPVRQRSEGEHDDAAIPRHSTVTSTPTNTKEWHGLPRP